MKALNHKKSIKKYKSTDTTARSAPSCGTVLCLIVSPVYTTALHYCVIFPSSLKAHIRREKVNNFIVPLSCGETEHSNRKTSQRELVKVMSTVAVGGTRTLSYSDLILMIRALDTEVFFPPLHSLYIGFLTWRTHNSTSFEETSDFISWGNKDVITHFLLSHRLDLQ